MDTSTQTCMKNIEFFYYSDLAREESLNPKLSQLFILNSAVLMQLNNLETEVAHA